METRAGAIDLRAKQRLEQQGHGSRTSEYADMDDVQLRYVLDLGRYERSHMGDGIVDACYRPVLVWISVLRAMCYGSCKGTRRRQALPAIALGNAMIGIVMVLNGTVGARLHIPFPVLNRSSFGFWLSYFSVISRVVLAMFWFGIQTTVGSECVYQVRFRLCYSSRTSHRRYHRC